MTERKFRGTRHTIELAKKTGKPFLVCQESSNQDLSWTDPEGAKW